MEWLEEKSVSEFLHWTGTYVSTNVLVTSSLAFPNTLLLGSWASAGMVLLHLDKLLCSTVIFRIFHQKWQVRVTSLGMCPTTVKHAVVQMYSHGILVVFVVLLAKCLKRLTNSRTPYALVHTMAAHTAFDYDLVTRGSSCNWSLCHVHFQWLHCSPF